jgi:hypothetical protein
MDDDRKILEEQIERRLKKLLNKIPDARSTMLREPDSGPDRGVDMHVAVELGNRRYEILVEVKSQGSPAMIRRSASQLKSFRRKYSATENIHIVFGAPYISDEGMAVCREEGIGGVDAAGNCYLAMGGIYIEVRGQKNPKPETRSVRFLFSPKSSRIIRVLLSDVNRWWQVQELAGEASISIGLASRLKQKMLEEEYVIETDRRVRAKSPARLIEAWTENYKYKRNTIREYYSPDDKSVVEQKIGEYCKRNSIDYALGLFSAASRLAPHVRQNKTFVFIAARPDEAAKELSLKPVSSGANVVLLQPYDAGVFYESSVIDGLNIVSDVQAYIDLKTYKGRGEEAAEFLMEHILENRWLQDPITDNVK